MSVSEFELIQRYFTEDSDVSGIVQGIGDDCAILQPPAGHQLAVSVDTLVCDVHFPMSMDPEKLGYRALAVNLSDLAATGATPWWFTLAITLPEADEDWLRSFSRGLLSLARDSGIALVGGDTTRGPLTITVQVAGLVPEGQALTRSGARSGDGIYVTGTLGDAAGGLACWPDTSQEYLRQRFCLPSPRLQAGHILRGVASSCIDISDGLLADLGHILKRSNVGASLSCESIPLSSELVDYCGRERALDAALTGGDDYELCFTLSVANALEIEQRLTSQDIPWSKIGIIEKQQGLRCLYADGSPYQSSGRGYQHF
ncbi:MAG: thiamine-phosphate kinase [Pseudomonadales bacterium]